MKEFYNEDCMEGMKRYPDKFFDLAIVDPPYGLDFGSYNRTNKTATGERYKANKYHNADWDKATPGREYFEELKRVSKDQIIWGWNYFVPYLNSCQCFIVWYKQNPVPNFSDCETAWTSFKKPAKVFDYRYYGNLEGNTSASEKIHPTQKPVALYKWILQNYAKEGDKILDTHIGSASSLIACIDLKYDYVGFEIDKEYYDNAVKRIEQFKSQLKLF